MFLGAKLSTRNYDLLLEGWSSQNVQEGVNFHAGSDTQFTNQVARDILTNEPNN